MNVKSYKDLVVWQKSILLVTKVYKLTDNLPKEEMYGLIGQMRRCSVSIPSNIAEGSRRSSRKDFRNFLTNVYGSGAELETQLIICKKLNLLQGNATDIVESLLEEVMRMLNKLVSNLQKSVSTHYSLPTTN